MFKAKYSLSFLVALAVLPTSQILAQPPQAEPIIDGSVAPSDKFPWMVGILETKKRNNHRAQTCGGVLISPIHVLTAAHCAAPEAVARPEELSVLTGTTALDGSGDRILVKRIRIHPEYKVSTRVRAPQANDIAILELAEQAHGPEVSLASPGIYPAGETALLLGWGEDDPTDPFNMRPNPRDLRQAEIAVPEPQICAMKYDNFDSNTQLCAGNAGSKHYSGRGSCNGDSGGPLLIKSPDGELRLHGVVSYGRPPCGKTEAVFTRVSAFREWIDSGIVSNQIYIPKPRTSRKLLSCRAWNEIDLQCKLPIRADSVATQRIIAKIRVAGKTCLKTPGSPQETCATQTGSNGEDTVFVQAVRKRAGYWQLIFKSPKRSGTIENILQVPGLSAHFETYQVYLNLIGLDDQGNRSSTRRVHFRP